MSDVMLTTGEVAERLRVTDQTVQSYLKAGRLRGVKLGRFWRVRPEDLESFLVQNSNEPMTDEGWSERLDALLTRIRSRVPPEMTEEEIEAEALAAVKRARQWLHARGR